ncbi:NDP-hexose 2,3-dehydratase family protein [Trichococcus shcherbakoviae]|uniref:NDP-hexose 2,3-dehydratase family protein n=1 Tax=Trichococcus shcherbakoviae TaxID=2094020 RepID=UPI002AA70803|nr:NDP-hexose 2,3-dehydratase family protein [Trichococcus shcherbakoviae]
MIDNKLKSMIFSWINKEGVNSTKSILEWVAEKNSKLEVKITKISLDESEPWYYDSGSGFIKNRNGTFFKIGGLQQYVNGKLTAEQPIIIQDEIGFLGIICSEIDNVLHFLMQAKIEPGNVNKIQISPTIQATKSNFMQKHGGKRPAFLEYFINAVPEQIIVDQIQSEQSSRFLKKRNRNVILFLEEHIDVPPTHMWMTLGQIKKLMHYDNLVNMDTRTVLSCIPFALMGEVEVNNIEFKDQSLLRLLMGSADWEVIKKIFHTFNDYKMFNDIETKIVDLYSLSHWHMENNAFVCDQPFPFKVIFCNLEIEGREVKAWNQPLFEANGKATFGLFICNDGNVKKFLVKATPEIGCFDGIELGPTIQEEAVHNESRDLVAELFFDKLTSRKGVLTDVILSEEGGRFYHEENRNLIIEIDKTELPEQLGGYFWCDYKTLNILVQVNNCLNIQLRNLLSLLEV